MTIRLLAAAAITFALASSAQAQFGPNPRGVVVLPVVVTPWVPPTPPLAVQQPGLFVFKGPDLLVNPVAGTVVRPQTGVAKFRDGSTFFRVPGSGAVNAFGQFQMGTETYFNPRAGTYYNPSSGVVVRPGFGW
jgi:hypothetical protein